MFLTVPSYFPILTEFHKRRSASVVRRHLLPYLIHVAAWGLLAARVASLPLFSVSTGPFVSFCQEHFVGRERERRLIG
jgi:hypothetical protein